MQLGGEVSNMLAYYVMLGVKGSTQVLYSIIFQRLPSVKSQLDVVQVKHLIGGPLW